LVARVVVGLVGLVGYSLDQLVVEQQEFAQLVSQHSFYNPLDMPVLFQ
jgi:hypothetical protein